MQSVRHLFALDLRSLALWRVATALLVLADLLRRSVDLVAHYTDAGVLPREVLRQSSYYFPPGSWSLYLLSGDAWFAGGLLILNAIAAIALLLGWRSRLAALMCWVLQRSIRVRNPLLYDGGDATLGLMLFWALWLPVGARYSLDAALDTCDDRALHPVSQAGSETEGQGERDRLRTMGTVAYTLQICAIYWFASLWKANPTWWMEGQAVFYAMNADFFVTDWGKWLLEFPPLMTAANYITLIVEAIGPLLLFVPGRWHGGGRLAAVGLFIAMHAGFRLTLNIGLFAWISAASWLAFVPGEVWDGWERRWFAASKGRADVQLFYDRDCGFCRKAVLLLQTFLMLPRAWVLPAQSDAAACALMEQHNSWVVREGTRSHLRFDGILCVFRLSPVGWLFVPLLRLGYPLGDRAYRWVAEHRRIASRYLAWLPFRPVDLREYPWQKVAIAAIVVWILAINLANVPFSWFLRLPPPLLWAREATGLNQRWSMFAPVPVRRDGWFLLRGHLADGRTVNLLRPDLPPTPDKPPLVSDLYPNQRWRKYFFELWVMWSPESNPLTEALGNYLCRTWRGFAPLQRVDVIFVEEYTNASPEPPAPPRDRLLRVHTCNASIRG